MFNVSCKQKSYPKTRDENIVYRNQVLQECDNNPDMQAKMMEMCKRDRLFWINTFCIAEGTLVVTDKGLVPIEDVTPFEKVWDGDQWVSQEGAVCKGQKPIIMAYNTYLTSNHKVRTINGWKEAIHRYDREKIRLPESQNNRQSGSVSSKKRIFKGANASSSKAREAAVYDLLNCGQKQAFTIIDMKGEPLLVHNCWTYDPRLKEMTNIPLITYPFQDELLLWDVECCDKSADNLVEKSRDMGVTWCFVANDSYDFLFSDDKIEVKWGSRNEDYVDKRGEMDSIFEKIRYLLKRLPLWMIPYGFNWKKHDNHMRIYNPYTESSLTGEATNPDFGRGGRKKRLRLDEFATWNVASEAWQSCADSTNCRTALSTVKGSGNKFAELAHTDIKKRSLHWTQHPIKNKGAYILQDGERTDIYLGDDPDAAYKIWLDTRHIIPPDGMIGGIVRSPWYDKECARRKDGKEVAEELDIDYLRSGAPFFDNRAVKNQTVWEYYKRERPTDPIKRGHHIRGNILDSAGKYTFRENDFGIFKLYEAPVRHGQYVVSLDIAEGLEKGDETFIVVRNKYTRDVCAVANGAYDPEDAAIYGQKLGMFFNKAKVAPENNNHGFCTCSNLQEMDCDLYWTTKKDAKGVRKRVKAGFTTTKTSRPQILDITKEEIKKISCEVRDKAILDQMLTFVHNSKTGKPEADGAFLDDGVIAFAIGGKVIDEHPYQPKTQAILPGVYNKIGRKNAGFSFGKK